MTDHSKFSFWLETCSDDLTPRRGLQRSIDVDIAILGGGYTGVWTAYDLLRANPNLSVAIFAKKSWDSAPLAGMADGAPPNFPSRPSNARTSLWNRFCPCIDAGHVRCSGRDRAFLRCSKRRREFSQGWNPFPRANTRSSAHASFYIRGVRTARLGEPVLLTQRGPMPRDEST